MALRRALLVTLLALTFVPTVFGSFGACHAADRRAAASAAVESMPCHQGGEPVTAPAQAKLRGAGCCADHSSCGLCNASGFTPAWPVAIGRQIGCSAQRADCPPAPVAAGGRALDHIPLV